MSHEGEISVMMLAQVVVSASPAAIDWQVIILAVVAMIPGLVAAYFANQARGTARDAKVASQDNGLVIAQVKEQTDGLARAAEDRGFIAGGADAKATVVADALTDDRQGQMIEAIVTRLLAAQTAQLTPTALADPGPQTARKLTQIKDVVDDVQPRVVAIEVATADRDAAVEKVASGTDERLTKLEEKKE